MTLSLRIPTDWQFGKVLPGQARLGAARQTIAQIIKQHLFAEDLAYRRTLLEFAAQLHPSLSEDTRKSARELWTWLLPEDAWDQTLAWETNPLQGTTPIEDAFCCATHGLCGALANAWEAEEEDNDEPAEDNSALPFRTEYHRAVSAVDRLVGLLAEPWLRHQADPDVKTSDDVRLIAACLLEALLAVTGDWFEVVTEPTVKVNGKPRTPKWIQVRSEGLSQKILALQAELPFHFTPQPLRQAVAYRLDGSGAEVAESAEQFRIDLIGYSSRNRFLRDFHRDCIKPEQRAPGFAQYVEAVNHQQAVAWRVNRPLLEVMKRLRELAYDPQAKNTAPDLADWVQARFYLPPKKRGRFKSKTIERAGEFLDNPLARLSLEELCPDSGDCPPFFLPWKADYRGRLYAETPWLTPQGGDAQKALLEFAQGHALNEMGVRALRLHGANLAKTAKILEDLSINNRQVLSLDERIQWVCKHEAQILASAENPLSESFWWRTAGNKKPLQFLAFCFAYRLWRDNPQALIHLPVQIDGTCNGLQHISALIGDEALAQAVNVLPRADGLPGDIYSELAQAASESLGSLSCTSQDIHKQGLEWADRWLAESPIRRGWINRDTAKRVVMTIPYGASENSQAHNLLESIADEFEREWANAPLEMLDQLLAWKEEDVTENGKQPRRIFVAKCCKGLFPELRKMAFRADTDELVKALAEREWEHKRTLAAYVALAIVKHLRLGLSLRYPAVDDFSDWLKASANACANMPLLWLTPLGFPVCQDKFKREGTSVSTRLGPVSVRIDVNHLGNVVDSNRQRDALLPNLIHSLDSTHLAMTLLDAKHHGVVNIGSIHDCLLCHPNDAISLGESVRRTFARLYLNRPLNQWREWIELMFNIKQVKDAGPVLGALAEPDGIGEKLLRAKSADKEVEHSITVLDSVRKLDPARQFMAIYLLRYLQNNPVKPVKVRKKFPNLISQSLPISTGDSLSIYFFC